MGGYIGATAVGLTTTAADVQGDITSTDTTPELILKNTTETDADGGRDGKITFKGEQSGGEESTLAQIQSSHDGTADDQAADLIFKTNDGSDGASPTEALRITSQQRLGIGTNDPTELLTVRGAAHFGKTAIATSADTPVIIKSDTDHLALHLEENSGAESWQIGVDADGDLGFHNSGAADATVTFDDSGNVGIGNTTSIDTTLYVDCGAPSSSDKTIATFQSQTSRQIGLFWDDSASNVGIGSRTNHEFAIHINGNSNPRAIFKDGSHCFTNTGYSGSLSSSDDGTLGTVFHLSGQQYWQRNANAASSETLIVNNIHSVGADIGVLQYRTRNTTEGSILGDGTGIQIQNVSDYRKKENVTNATGCLDKVVALRPVTYTYKEQYTTDTSKEHLGLIAHEVADVMPTMVKGEKDAVQKWTKPLDGEEPLPDGVSVGDNKLDADGNTIPDLQSLSYSHNEMITNLIGAIKELKAENDAMRTRLDALESE